MNELAAGHRAGGARPPPHPQQALLRRPGKLRSGAEHPGVRGRSRASRGAPGAQPRSGADGGPVRPRGGRPHRAPMHIRAQELLLPGSPQGLPDQPVRGSDHGGGDDHRRAGGRAPPRNRARARASRGGCRPVGARGIRRTRPESTSTGRARPSSRSSPSRSIHGAAEAAACMRQIHTLVRWLGICDGNMQEGSFRCDANVSVRPAGSGDLGTRTEIKNLNSFRFVETGHRLRDGTADRPHRVGGRGGPGNPPLRPRAPRDAADAGQGGGGRLPLFPGPRPAPGRRRRGVRRGGAGETLPELPDVRRRSRLVRRVRNRRGGGGAARVPPRSGELLRGGRRGRDGVGGLARTRDVSSRTG